MDDEDDLPSADPNIRLEYESFLGSILVQFNAIDVILSDIIHMALQRAKRPEILSWIGDDMYARKVTTLALLQVGIPDCGDPELIETLRRLGAERNKLAHGHFDQNPFDGSYSVVALRRGERVSASMPVEKMADLLDQARAVMQRLRQIETRFVFDEFIERGNTEVPDSQA